MDVSIIIIIVVFVLFFSACLVYALVQLNKKSSNCDALISKVLPTLGPISSNDPLYMRPLRDFYIKASYNSCASGALKNDYVDLCALDNAIKQGCRFLDFEIYNEAGVPVVAVSDSVSFYQKGSYNSLPLDLVLKQVDTKAFSNTDCPNANDVMLLCFRLKTADMLVINQVAAILAANLSHRLLPNENSYENNGLNLGQTKLTDLFQKVVVMADKKNPAVDGSKLKEYINIGVNTPFVRLLTFNEVAHTPDIIELKAFNQQNITISAPNPGETANYDSQIMRNFAVQISAMSMQINDANLKKYNAFFNTKAFVVRDELMNYKPVPTPTPPPLDPANGFQENTYTGANYNITL
jgi:hypothetical protein